MVSEQWSSSVSERTTQRRNGETRLGLYGKILSVVILHLICCIGLAMTMTYALHGYHAVDATSSRYIYGRFKLRVSDVTTLISAALTVVKLLVSAWTGIIIWNCIFILLQRQGITLPHINRVMTYYIPPVPRHPTTWLLVLLLLLVVPQQLSSPLLSGAVGWGASFELGPVKEVASRNPIANAELWYWYGVWNVDKRAALRRAAAFASLAWAGLTPDHRHCRHLMNEDQLPINSSIFNVVIPCIQIHSITWPEGPPSQEVRNLTLNNYSEKISRVEDTPLHDNWSGNAAIYNPADLDRTVPPQIDDTYRREYPEPFLFSGEMTAVILIIEQSRMNDCKDLEENIFNMPRFNNDTVWTSDTSGVYENCFSYAIVNFTAGVVTSPTSTYISSRVIEADKPDTDLIIEPGTWVKEATYLMSDTMSMLSAMNTTSLGTWNNRTGYLDKLVRYSYLASWDSLFRGFDERNTSLEAYPRESTLKASVSHERVFGWLAISVLMTLSSILLVTMPSLYRLRGIVIDGPAAALMTDPRGVLGDNCHDLTNLSYLTNKEGSGKEGSEGLGALELKANKVGRVDGYILVKAHGHTFVA